MPEAGDKIDRFVVERVLGRGGMATVYLVRHLTLGSAHALKVLDIPLPSIRTRLVQEGRVQAQLAHPHIVAVTDLIDVEGAPGLIMEFVPGPTLDTWLREGPHSAAALDQVFEGVLEAMAFAHDRGLVHRDLKPANVLLHASGGRLIPKVSDFGLAKVLGGESAGGQTRTGFAMGTPGYMAPEQIRNAKDVDARADVFALACILYEMWSGRPAFAGEDPFSTLVAIDARPYADPRSTLPDLPERVATIVRAGLEPDREARPADANAVRSLWLGGSHAREAPPQVGSSLRPPAPVAPRRGPTFDVGAALESDPPHARRRYWLPGVLGGLGVGVLACLGLASAGVMLRWPEAADEGAAAGPEVEAASAPAETPPGPGTEDVRPGAAATARHPALPVATPATTGGLGASTEAPPGPAAGSNPAAAGAVVPGPATGGSTAAPSVESPAAFQLSGNADDAWLSRGGRRYPPGPVPAGTYTLYAKFGSARVEYAAALEPGETLLAACDRGFAACTLSTR